MNQEPNFNYRPPSANKSRRLNAEPQQIKKIAIWGVAILVAILAVLGFISATNVAKLVVSAEEGSTIYVTRERGGDFEEIGTTKATYTSREAGPVHIKITKEASATITTAQLELRQTVEVTPALDTTSNSSKIAGSPLSNLHIKQDFVYGLNPSTNSPDYVSYDPGEYTYLYTTGLPLVDKVSFYDPDYYIYRDYIENVVGVVKDRSLSQSLNGYYDFVSLGKSGFLLLGNDGLYTLNSKAKKDKVTNLAELKGGSLFSSGSKFFISETLYTDADHAHTEGEELSEPLEAIPMSTRFFIVDNDYEILKEFSLDIQSPITSVVEVPGSNQLLLVADGAIQIVDTDSGNLESKQPFYFAAIQDVVTINDKILVLSRKGLWQYDHGAGEFRLINLFPENEVFVVKSLTLSSDGKSVYYSTRVDREYRSANPNQAAQGGIYRVNF
ncbi:MAG: hypothetical protein R3313_00085 [Candidatus Saccharimonadales bacterium]|nr:hypothetical protein [Candidatus Saccharimonadales bacterium]